MTNLIQKIIARLFYSKYILGNKYLNISDFFENLKSKKRKSILEKLVNIGKSSVIYPEAIIYNPPNDPSRIVIGENSHIQGELHIFNYGGRIEIGNNTYIGKDSRIWSGDNVKIGNNVLISHFCNIIDTNSHEINPYERAERSKEIFSSGHWKTKGSIKTSPITIKDYAWISFNVSILKGVTIGEGAIIGACSVVTDDVPDFALAIGNPAKVIKIIPQEERLKNYEKL